MPNCSSLTLFPSFLIFNSPPSPHLVARLGYSNTHTGCRCSPTLTRRHPSSLHRRHPPYPLHLARPTCLAFRCLAFLHRAKDLVRLQRASQQGRNGPPPTGALPWAWRWRGCIFRTFSPSLLFLLLRSSLSTGLQVPYRLPPFYLFVSS